MNRHHKLKTKTCYCHRRVSGLRSYIMLNRLSKLKAVCTSTETRVRVELEPYETNI